MTWASLLCPPKLGVYTQAMTNATDTQEATMDLAAALPIVIKDHTDEAGPMTAQEAVQEIRQELDTDEVANWQPYGELGLTAEIIDAYAAVVSAELGVLNEALKAQNISPVTV